jgi:hypothetical protein
MGLQDLAAALRPVCADDEAEWSVLVDQAGSGGDGQLVWYASSALDLYPFTAICCGYPLPASVQSRLFNPILVMSDYSTNYLETLREAYAALDDGPVLALEPGRFGQAAGFGRFAHNCGADIYPLNGRVWIEQMIPLRLWSESERDALTAAYQERYGFVGWGRPCAITDTDWHLVYLLFRFEGEGVERYLPAVFVAAENLLVFREIFERFKIPIEAFLAVRVAGKSGSWDGTHDFQQGELPRAIKNADPALCPVYWGADAPWSPLPFRKKECTIPGLGFGGCTVYKTGWR